MMKPISIMSIGSVSSLGTEEDEIWRNYTEKKQLFQVKKIKNFQEWLNPLTEKEEIKIKEIQESNPHYLHVDRSVLLAIFAAKKALVKTNWDDSIPFGVNIGSSRGATELWEKNYQKFIQSNHQKTDVRTSPTTTLGNISSWVAQELNVKGPVLSHSITCSSALHALLNAYAWLQSGMCDYFIAGGSEAPLTDFTLAQMKALKIYAEPNQKDFPCESLHFSKKKNSMILAEGAAMFCLEKDRQKNAKAIIEAIGYGQEKISHHTSMSEEGICFQASMEMALKNIPKNEVDLIVMHAPGTILGDQSEYNAIQKVFGQNHPAITSNKWILGHSLGASGAFSLEFAVAMLQNQTIIESPFYQNKNLPKKLNKILINAVGFGGNAVSVLVCR